MNIQFDLFEHLIKSPSKDFLNQILLESFEQSENKQASEIFLKQLTESLDIDQTIGEQLLNELAKFIRKLIFDGSFDLQQIQNSFASSNLQPNLKNLLSKLLVERVAQFKNKLLNEENMMPKLIDFDWRVDIKMDSNLSSNDETSKSGQQTCLLQLKNEQSKEGLSNNKPRNVSINKQPILDISEIIKQQFKKRSEKQLGLLSYLARLYPNDKCGSNGLPLTPNSIRIYGKFQYLKMLTHKNLCRYIDIQRGQNERLFVISEHYSLNLNDLLNDTYIYNLIIANMSIIFKWIDQMLKCFIYLNQHMIVNRLLSLKNVCITPSGDIKLANYGMFYMTEYGYCVDFSIANFVTLPPECYLLEYFYANKNLTDAPISNNELLNSDLYSPKSDVWSFGCLLFQFIFGLSTHTQSSLKHFNELLSPERIINLSIDLISDKNNNQTGYEFMLKLYEIDEVKKTQIEQKTNKIFLDLIKKCLTIDPVKRPDFKELYNYFLTNSNQINKTNNLDESFEDVKLKLFNDKLRLFHLENDQQCEKEEEDDDLWRRGVYEVYYLWRLAAGDCLQTLKQNGRLKTNLMPIHKFSIYTTVDDGYEHGKVLKDNESLLDDNIVPINLSQLRTRLNSIKKEAFYPKIEGKQSNHVDSNLENVQKQPVNIRELDIEYQFNRMILFSRYLSGYPFKRDDLIKECQIDIPPLYRNLAWACLLDVDLNIMDIYACINKEQITSTDRQIDVDIPRCHQYDPLMASPQAHIKLKRVLKSWVISNPNLVYWQGLDSLCAPFLYLNFNQEHLAFGCLTNFINKYAAKFFLKDNSAVIHEYLAVFSHLIAFHDPELASHFELIDFRPDLYAIPWFLTMFAHVFPLYKIFHLWDSLLLGSSGFPLCIGASILKQLRTILLNSDFNECILLFSELPEINIEKCVSDSSDIYLKTPSSCLYREHSENVLESREIDSNDEDMSPIGLEQMRAELCPRVSVRDVLLIYESKPVKLIMIDLRSVVEYKQMYVVGSKNIPYENLNLNKLSQLMSSQINSTPNENDSNLYLSYLLQQNKNVLKVLIASEIMIENVVELANNLVRFKVSKVCILHKGIESFRNTKMFQIN